MKRAFTLVELLVVIAIASILIALLIPAIIAAKNATQNRVDQQQIQQGPIVTPKMVAELPAPPDKNIIKQLKKETIEGIDYTIITVGTQRLLIVYRGTSIAIQELEE